MKRRTTSGKVLMIAIVLLGMTISALQAQTAQEGAVGINTHTPQTTLDVTGTPADASRMDGITAPRLTGEQLRAKTYTAAQDGAIVYVTLADPAPAGQTLLVECRGYYYFDKNTGSTGLWIPFRNCNAILYHVKQITVTDCAGGSTTLVTSGSTQLDVEVLPSYATNGSVVWTSSNTSVATVNTIGEVTALSVGSVVITATAADGSGVSDSYNVEVISNTVTDVDGNTYPVKKIGCQVWFTENLKTTKYNDNTPIKHNRLSGEWQEDSPAYCWYNMNEAVHKDIYGALYNWYAVDAGSNGGKNICPTGWHVPTRLEFNPLSEYLGGADVAGGKLKEAGTAHWKEPNTGATNSTGFTAVPSGDRSSAGGFYHLGIMGTLWTSSSSNVFWSHTALFHFKTNELQLIQDPKRTGMSVRCLKD